MNLYGQPIDLGEPALTNNVQPERRESLSAGINGLSDLLPQLAVSGKGVIMTMGMRTSCATTDLSEILPEEIETQLKAAAEVSMGTEITPQDLANIHALAEQVISFAEYRQQLSSYLTARMNAIAPNLTVLVGELVGARLIAHAGSLINLSKAPASTLQILGAEKALFRALKTKGNTPKYGLIYVRLSSL